MVGVTEHETHGRSYGLKSVTSSPQFELVLFPPKSSIWEWDIFNFKINYCLFEFHMGKFSLEGSVIPLEAACLHHFQSAELSHIAGTVQQLQLKDHFNGTTPFVLSPGELPSLAVPHHR